MLRNLGTVFYLLAAVSILIFVMGVNTGLTLAMTIAVMIGNLFFGAVCIALDDIRELLARIAGVNRVSVSQKKGSVKPRRTNADDLESRPDLMAALRARVRGEQADDGAAV